MKILFTICIVCFSLIAFAQNNSKSIHQEESEKYKAIGNDFDYYESLNQAAKKSNNTTEEQNSCVLNKVVYGWHPYWMNGVQSNYKWNLLSHLCYFSYEVDATTGKPSSTHGWYTTQVVTDAINAGVKVDLCVTLFSGHSTFFGSQASQDTLINRLIKMVQLRGANGVNIDFEGLGTSSKAAFTSFMNKLADSFHTQIPGSQVSTVLYSVDWNDIFDEPAMASKVDYFIIMGYDYYYGGSTTAGPNDPLYHFGSSYNYTLSKTLTYYLNQGVPNSKLILGLPWYGREYGTVSNTIPSAVNGPPNSTSRTFKVIKDNTSGNFSAANKKWEADSYTPYYVYQSGGEWRQCFANDGYSIGRRMDLINQRNIGGMGIWALGYDDGYNDYWNAIQNHFSSCSVTACNDSLFDMGGPNKSYYDKEKYNYTISPQDADQVKITFSSFNLETNYDSLWIYNGNSITAPLLGVYTGTALPPVLTTTNPSFTLKFKSDNATVTSGFKLNYECIQNIIPPDTIPPSTTFSTSGGNWKTDDFTTNFSDEDNGGSGIEKSFYSTAYFDGDEWLGSSNHGFFNDEFLTDTINPQWTDTVGVWSVNNGNLIQSDEMQSNSNIYAELTQDLSNRYLYHWKAKMGGTQTNKRSGLHYFCDDAKLNNRGNSYFAWFRETDNRVELYKVTNNTFSRVMKDTLVIDPNVEYDYKVVYDRILGKHQLYFNDSLVLTYIDTLPLATGNAISFRSGSCRMDIDFLRVYRSRYPSVTIGVGSGEALPYCNPNPAQKAGLIRSITQDSAAYLSEVYEQFLDVDFTPPICNITLNDGTDDDIDVTTDSTTLAASWTNCVDSNSAISGYIYAIGTSPVDTNTVGWTDIGNNNVFVQSLLDLDDSVTYYVTIKSINGAGLESDGVISDGVIYLDPKVGLNETQNRFQITPNPFIDIITLRSDKAMQSIEVIDVNGKIIMRKQVNNKNEIKLSFEKTIPSGIYFIKGNSEESFYLTKIIKE